MAELETDFGGRINGRSNPILGTGCPAGRNTGAPGATLELGM
ncbi:hypothetical protein [Persicitalea jodogahamensis]|nr:hypothetical protein [Persicitalea jodogahamensis]